MVLSYGDGKIALLVCQPKMRSEIPLMGKSVQSKVLIFPDGCSRIRPKKAEKKRLGREFLA